MKKYFLFLLLCCISISAADKFDYNIMQNKIDVLHYSIQLGITDKSNQIVASTEITFKSINDIQELKFNLKDLEVVSCKLESAFLKFDHHFGILTIQLRKVIPKNSIRKITIDYTGTPKTGLVIGKNKYNNFSAFSDNWANFASNWFPSIDHPSDKATASFFVTVPKKYEVICNGDLIETTFTDQEAKYTYSIKEPIPTYCIAIGVCDFAITKTKTSSGIPVFFYTYPEDSLNAINGFRRVTDMISFYEETIVIGIRFA